MKKALCMSLVWVIALTIASVLAFAGPFAGFDYKIPDTARVYFGVQTGPLSLKLSVIDLFTTPGLSLEGVLLSEYSFWKSKVTASITKIDPITYYPIPTIEGLAVAWRGTVHLGALASLAAESPIVTSWYTLDLYGEVRLVYDRITTKLTPVGRLGFYWKL